jgi:pimeloyl-ACP methyl ester carboxylesterase
MSATQTKEKPNVPMAPVSNGQLYYEEQGTGELIVLLPGLGHDHTYFAKTLPLLAAAGRVVTPDPRGLGQSSPAQSYSVERWAGDLLELIAHLSPPGNAPRAHLVGSSLGACVCLQAALDDPARVASLTLVAGFSEVDPLLEMNFRTRLQILDEVGLGDIMASHVSMWTLGRTFLATAAGRAQMDKLFASVRKNSPERYRAFIQTILRFGRCEPDQAGLPKLTARLGEIRVPTRVICGGEDIMTPPALSERMAARIPGAEFRVIADCGHITFTEKPDECAQLILGFLRGVMKL